jgi:hypothetical protein
MLVMLSYKAVWLITVRRRDLPIIRIDDEVYTWLQSKGRAFEDTPNTVLQRLRRADLGEPEPPKPTETPKPNQESDALPKKMLERIDGKQLNEEWDVGARHALYHKDGTWYHILRQFPGALFDPNGYIRFNSEHEYRHHPHISIKEQMNHTVISSGISSLPGYVRKR